MKKKHGLIIIDMIHDYLDSWDVEMAEGLIQNTNTLVASFRQRQLPIIWVRNEFKPDLSDAFLEMREKQVMVAIEGTRGARLHSGLQWSPADITVVKKRYSAFFGTDLDGLLAEHDVGSLVICGINTHACVRMATIDAYQRDFPVILAEECIGTYDDEHGRISLRYMKDKIAKVATISEIRSLIEMAAQLPSIGF